MKRYVSAASILGLLALAVVLLQSETSTEPTQDTSPYVVGVSASLTGPAAFIGEQYLQGLEMAQEEINSAGGIHGRRLEIAIEDNGNDASMGISAFHALQMREPDLLITTMSVASVPISPLAHDVEMPLLASVVFADIVSGNENSVSFFPTPYDDASATVLDMKSNNVSNVGVLYVQSEYGEAGLNAFMEVANSSGLSLVATERFLAGSRDFATPLLKLTEEGCDAVYIIAINATPIVEQVKALKPNLQVYVNLIPVFGNLVFNNPDVYEGVHATALPVDVATTDSYVNFRAKIAAHIGVAQEEVPNGSYGYAAVAYDNLYAVAKTLTKEPDAHSFVHTFANMGAVNGINGTTLLSGRNVGMRVYPVTFAGGGLK